MILTDIQAQPFLKFSIKSHDGLNIVCRELKPVPEPVAVIVWLHGFGEHSARYNELALRFIKNNCAFVTFDFRGHGESEGKRGDCPGIEALDSDIAMMIQLSQDSFPDVPLVLAGHSMGGGLALHYALNHANEISGIIAFSPWLRLVAHPSHFKKMLARIIKWIKPGWQSSSRLQINHISHDSIEVQKYRSDSLIHGLITPRLFFVIQKAGFRTILNAKCINIPCLVLHGTGDKITSHNASMDFVKRTDGMAELKLWDDLYHELHHEKERNAVFEYSMNWIENKVLK